jgi:hypothetical protein
LPLLFGDQLQSVLNHHQISVSVLAASSLDCCVSALADFCRVCSPQLLGNWQGIDFQILPPCHLIAGLMQLAMMTAGLQDRPFQMRVSEGFLRTVDDWRRRQKDLPSRAEAIRRLVELAVRLKTPPERDS